MSILFLAKAKPFAEDAAEIINMNFNDARIVFGNLGEPFPDELLTEQFDYVISYISPWIVPLQVLNNTRKASINLHPGPPEYPGIGCTNFAIYNGENEFGITVHHMNAKVDTGDIIDVERFPIFENDSVFTLTQRCYAFIYTSLLKVVSCLLSGDSLPESNETWTRRPYTRKQLNELCVITSDMNQDEVNRRVKATTFPNMPGAFVKSDDHKIEVGNG